MAKVRVKAVREGFDGTQLRKPGEEFDLELGEGGKIGKGSWVQEVKAPAKKAENPGDGETKQLA